MAKWGEGDPRWIVEDRPDATNVNNWHWTEKNASAWSIDRLKKLLTNLQIKGSIGYANITEVAKCDGEATANNRKAKLIFFYEWNLKLAWKGKVNGKDEEIKGEIEIPNLSEENSADDIDVNVSVDSVSVEGAALKDMLRTTGTEIIRKQLDQYIKDLKEEYAKDLILPKKDEVSVEQPKCPAPAVVVKAALNNQVNRQEKASDSLQRLNIGGVKLSVGKITQKHSFKCTAAELFNVLTIPEMVQAFTRGPVVLDARKGAKFEMFDGLVEGDFVNVELNRKIEQRWRFRSWPSGHYSKVSFTITQKEDSTDLEVLQTDVPLTDLERTREGWNHYYWDSIKKTFGFGALLV